MMADSVRPLKVHLVHQSFGDYVSALVDGLAEPDRSPPIELSVTTIANSGATLSGITRSKGSGSADDANEYHHDHREVPRFRDPRCIVASLRIVRSVVSSKCDVIHWQAAGNPWVDLAFSLLMKRKPTVLTIHDMVPHPGDRNVLPGTFFAIKRLARLADRVTVHAPHVRQQVIDAGVDGAKVRVIAHGELATRYLPADRLPLPPPAETDDPTVLFFGRAQGYKGLDLLVEAMSELNRAGTKIRLVVAGSGPAINSLFPSGSGVPDWCTLRSGHIPTEDVPALFAQAAAVALPYREASQSGVAALAAGFGRPVVATAVPGLTDIVEDGTTGLLVTPNDPAALAAGLLQAVADRSMLEHLSKGAYEAAETRLSWSTITAELRSVYLEALRS